MAQKTQQLTATQALYKRAVQLGFDTVPKIVAHFQGQKGKTANTAQGVIATMKRMEEKGIVRRLKKPSETGAIIWRA